MSIDQTFFSECLLASGSFETMIYERAKMVSQIFKTRGPNQKLARKNGPLLFDCADYSATARKNEACVMKIPATETGPREKYNDYQVISHLGRGQYGSVAKVRNEITGEMFAMKVVINKAAGKYNQKLTKENLDKVNAEIQLLRAVKHPHISLLKEVLYPTAVNNPNLDAEICIIQELCSGPTMSQEELFEGSAAPFPPERAWTVFRQMLSAVAYLHDHKYVHGDIKPENLLFHTADKDSIVKLVDFGESQHFKLIGEDDDHEQIEEQMQRVMGTQMFAAPEVWSPNTPYSGTLADIYSMGVTLYALIFGRLPFISQSLEQLFREKERPINASFWGHDGVTFNS